MPSRLSIHVPLLVAGMLLTGSSNSLWSKYQDMQCVENCADPDPAKHLLFEQPVWQTLQMFLGEMLCFLPVLYSSLSTRFRSRNHSISLGQDGPDDDEHSSPQNKPPTTLAATTAPVHALKGWSVLLFWLPAACDLTGTTLMNIGLLYTPVSIYQMTRGSVVLAVGVLSVLFLSRRLWLFQWLSLFTVMLGVSLVGYAGSLIRDTVKDSSTLASLYARAAPEPIEEPEVTTVFVGVLFVLFAQVFTATQFVVEEKILGRYAVAPLMAVGLEGFFGFISILILLPLVALFGSTSPSSTIGALLAPESKYAAWFDLTRGWHQIVETPSVLWSSIAIAFSIAFFNFFGLSVTRRVSATVRSLTDTCRTLCIWIVSLGLGWEKLVWPVSLLQVTGFGLVVYGSFSFNSIIRPPSFLLPRQVDNVDVPAIVVTDDEAEERLALLADAEAAPEQVEGRA